MQKLTAFLGALVLAVLFIAAPASAQVVFNFNGDTTGDPTFARPFTVGDGTAGSCSLSGFGNAVPYEATSFTPANSGVYDIEVSSTDDTYDEYIHLYNGVFDPANPCVNLIALDDQGGAGSLIEDVELNGGTMYTIVVDGFGNDDFGPYTGTVTRTGDIPPDPVVVFNFAGDTTDDPTFARPTGTTCAPSTFADSTRYEVTTFTPNRDSEYAIQTDYGTPGYDGYLVLYEGTFDPTMPCMNRIAFDDDFNGLSSSRIESVMLMANTTYSIVVTGFNNDDFGLYTGFVEDLDPPVGPEIDLTAMATSSLTVAPGGSIMFSYTISNTSGAPAMGDLFFVAQRNGNTVRRGLIRSGTLQDGQTISGTYTQQVPGSAPAGSYDYSLNIGRFPGVTVDSEAFTVVVTGTARVAMVDAEVAKAEGDESYFKALEASLMASAEGWSVVDATPWVSESTTLSAAARADVVGAFPNPFARSTEIGFELDRAADVSLVVYDVRGREVATLAEGTMDAGQHTVSFDAASLPSGVYIYRLTAGSTVETGRMTLVQ